MKIVSNEHVRLNNTIATIYYIKFKGLKEDISLKNVIKEVIFEHIDLKSSYFSLMKKQHICLELYAEVSNSL